MYENACGQLYKIEKEEIFLADEAKKEREQRHDGDDNGGKEVPKWAQIWQTEVPYCPRKPAPAFKASRAARYISFCPFHDYNHLPMSCIISSHL